MKYKDQTQEKPLLTSGNLPHLPFRSKDAAAPAGVRRKLIKWVNGVPLPVDSEIIPADKDNVKKLMEAAASLPYEGEGSWLGLEPELFGHTKLEVMMIRLMKQAASGDMDAIKIVLDRLMGKPEQISKSMEVTGTYKEFLELLDKKDKADEPETIIDTSALG